MVRSYRDVLAAPRSGAVRSVWSVSSAVLAESDGDFAPLCLTDNGAVAFESTLSPCVDFFFDVMQNSEEAVVKAKLDAAWHEDPLTALKLLFHLRDVRHGKGARLEAFYGLMHLYQHHTATLLANIRHIPASGCWKDLLQLCEYAYYGRVGESPSKQKQNKRKLEGEAMDQHNRQRQRNVPAVSMTLEDIVIGRLTGTVPRSIWRAHLRSLRNDEERQAAQDAFRDAAERYQQAVLSSNAAATRRRHVQDRREVTKLQLDAQPAFRGVYDACADAFAAALSRDRDTVAAGGSLGLEGLAGKWAPTPGHAADRELDLAHAIALRMYPVCAGEAENAARQRALREYRRMLTPLRAAAAVPEQQMSAKAWSEVIYERVPSVCMNLNKKHFQRHDSERFQQYLDAVEKGKKKIASGALLPHQLVQQARECCNCSPELKTVELQWQSYVQQLRSIGTLGSMLAVCDVSGSMTCPADAKTGATCMDVAIALSLLLCEIADPPCKDTVCSFHNKPQLLRLTGGSLKDRIGQLERMDWGMNTNIDRVFDLLLGLAKVNQLAPERMVRTVYIFSDMQFDDACQGTTTNFQKARAKFERAGYKLPGIVFWNLYGEHAYGPRGGSRSMPKPVTHREDGTALISGFSGMILKRLLTMGELADPQAVMMECLDGLYDYLEVVD